jgi:hypothetical protein
VRERVIERERARAHARAYDGCNQSGGGGVGVCGGMATTSLGKTFTWFSLVNKH